MPASHRSTLATRVPAGAVVSALLLSTGLLGVPVASAQTTPKSSSTPKAPKTPRGQKPAKPVDPELEKFIERFRKAQAETKSMEASFRQVKEDALFKAPTTQSGKCYF